MTPPTSARVGMSWDRPGYDALLTILEQTNSLAEATEAILAAGWTPPRRGPVLRDVPRLPATVELTDGAGDTKQEGRGNDTFAPGGVAPSKATTVVWSE